MEGTVHDLVVRSTKRKQERAEICFLFVCSETKSSTRMPADIIVIRVIDECELLAGGRTLLEGETFTLKIFSSSKQMKSL